MLELLAPAGSMDALKAAVQNGANAVYLGVSSFNARQGAKNFTPHALTEAVKYCHIRGVQVHLTLNTLVSDREISDVSTLIIQAAKAGVDAFIVQDLGVLQLCKQLAPKVAIHGSTQLTVHNLAGVQQCAAWGMSRVVLSRELSREEIAYICQNSPIEIEVFGHGALCMCYSGQCHLSAAIGGRSGNRGRCAQPCRQCYGYTRPENRYPLSLKDNCLVQHVRELEGMGVASLKLEGRMKRPEYVAAVTGVYRKALDTGVVTEEMMRTLYNAFNRQGFTDGYYTGKLGKNMFGIREEQGDNERWYRSFRQTYENAENPLVPITFQALVTPEMFSLTVQDNAGNICTLEGPAPEVARVMPLTEEALAERLKKTGGTPYYCTDVQANIGDNLTLSASAVNSLRRDALNMLTAVRSRLAPVRIGRAAPVKAFPSRHYNYGVTVQVTTREQITPRLLKIQPAVLYVPLYILAADIEFTKKLTTAVNVCAVLPRIVHDKEMEHLQQDMRAVRSVGVNEVLVGNIGLLGPALECRMIVRGDFGLNIYNSASVNAARGMDIKSVCLSPEMTMPQIRAVSKAADCELMIYGRMQLMITENCLFKGKTGQCMCHLGNARLKDKTGAEFPIMKDGESCRSILLNGKKLYWLDRQHDLSRLGLWAVRLCFTTEAPREVDQVMNTYLNPTPFDPGAFTRGLYLRGLD